MALGTCYVTVRNRATEGQLKFKFEAGDEGKTKKAVRVLTDMQRAVPSSSTHQPTDQPAAGERGRRERKWRESVKGEAKRNKEGRGGAKGVRGKER